MTEAAPFFFDSSALIGVQPSVTRKRVRYEALYKPNGMATK